MIISKWHDRIFRLKKTKINHKELERDIGFLVHLSMTYSNMKPFLKGFYSTLNEWRHDRDEKGWKLSHKAYQRFLQLGRRSGPSCDELEVAVEENEEGVPDTVTVVPLMRDHLKVLSTMLAQDQPVLL